MKPQKPAQNYYSLQSNRLTFRSFKEGDIQLWETFFENNPTLRFLGMGHLKTSNKEKATSWVGRQIEREENGAFGQLAVLEKESNRFVGVGGIIERDLDGVQEFEITYSFLPEVWGKGYATELAIFFKNYAFEHINPPSVISIIHTENKASMNVARKNGMKKSGETTFMEMPVYIFRAENPNS